MVEKDNWWGPTKRIEKAAEPNDREIQNFILRVPKKEKTENIYKITQVWRAFPIGLPWLSTKVNNKNTTFHVSSSSLSIFQSQPSVSSPNDTVSSASRWIPKKTKDKFCRSKVVQRLLKLETPRK
mmetsp:Transcript_34733/g.72291  ORF Transcript_34733/g.72291 Transcript_34733/m.72291 type:complete len:125 (-) Transcript_34733:467-841(-)